MTSQAVARQGYSVRGVELYEQQVRIECNNQNNNTELNQLWPQDLLVSRMTHRGEFAQTPRIDLTAISARDDVTVSQDQAIIESLAELNDDTSLGIMRAQDFRDELRHWMRLSTSHPDWQRDGMNIDAMGMSRLEAGAANFVLRAPLFETLDKLGLGRVLTGEAAKTRSAHWVLAFYRPESEDPLHSGEAFYEIWLMLTAYGQSAWPMTALADDPHANKETSRLLQIPAGQRLINVLRVGPLPQGLHRKARMPASELIDV